MSTFLQDCFHPQVSNGLHWYPSVVSEFIAKSIATTLRPASILDHYQEIPIPSKTQYKPEDEWRVDVFPLYRGHGNRFESQFVSGYPSIGLSFQNAENQ